MICSKCKIKMRKIKTDYNYTESGLENVILKGIIAFKCPRCRGINPIISKIKEVHKTIAQQLLIKGSLLTGKEIAYLRKEMKIKAKDLAEIIGVTKVTVSRWENEKEQISPACDRLIRSLYDNKLFKQACEIVRPGIDKLESQFMKSILITLCEPKTLEDVFRNIKRRQIHSKITIPISTVGLVASALPSDLSINFMERENFCARWFAASNLKQEITSGSSAGTGALAPTDLVTIPCAGTTLLIDANVGVGSNVRIGTTVDELISPFLTLEPSGHERASSS